MLIEKRVCMRMKLLKIEDLANNLNISRSTIWRWRKQKIIPEPIAIGPRLVAWRASDIEDWLENIQKGREV